jgi:dihydroorotase
MRVILKNFRIIDEETDVCGTVIIDDGFITGLLPGKPPEFNGAAIIIDGGHFSYSKELPVLMPAFVDLHAHFRDPGLPEKGALLPSELSLLSEVLESASLAAAAGGFGTVVCMANTKPAIDSLERAMALKERSDALGLIDLYPVISLTKGMEGKELSEISILPPRPTGREKSPDPWKGPLMLSEDGKDLENAELFLAAMMEAKRIGVPVSCHCDFSGSESIAVSRAIELGRKAGCHIHIAHVSTGETLKVIRQAKAETMAENGEFALTCEAMPHNLCLTEKDARKLGEKTWGRVNPPLRSEEDRQALIRALTDGTVDAIATDHAPHSRASKEVGAPGFSGFETAFSAVYTELVRGGALDLKSLSSLMSARPARLLGFGADRSLMLSGYRADLTIIDTETPWIVQLESLKTRGKNSAFAGRQLWGKILMTFHAGRVVFSSAV